MFKCNVFDEADRAACAVYGRVPVAGDEVDVEFVEMVSTIHAVQRVRLYNLPTSDGAVAAVYVDRVRL